MRKLATLQKFNQKWEK